MNAVIYTTTVTITFDTHKFIKTLESACIPEAQAEAMVKAQQESLQAAFDYRNLATKGDIMEVKTDLKAVEHRLDLKIERLTSEITLLKWMNGLVVGGIIALIIKAFFA